MLINNLGEIKHKFTTNYPFQQAALWYEHLLTLRHQSTQHHQINTVQAHS